MKISKIIAAALSLSFLISTAATTNSNTQNTSITANADLPKDQENEPRGAVKVHSSVWRRASMK